MTGTIRWFRGLAKSAPEKVFAKNRELLREGPAVANELGDLCAEALVALLDRTDAEEDEVAVTYIAAQFLDAMSAAVSLLEQGRIRASLSQLRAMIEARVVMEYVRGNTERGRAWFQAKTASDRFQFSFAATYAASSMPADMWKGLWDTCNENVHTNYAGFPVQSRMRPVYGGDTYIGPFYDPPSTANLFLICFAIGHWLADLLIAWYGEHSMFPNDFAVRLEQIKLGWGQYSTELRARADTAHKAVEREIGTLSLADQVTAREIFENYQRRASESPINN